MTRTSALLARVKQQIETISVQLEQADDLEALKIEVFYSPGCVQPRRVVVTLEPRKVISAWSEAPKRHAG